MVDSLDQRRTRRYFITLDVQFEILKNGKVMGIGSGETRDVSRAGIFFTTKHLLEPGWVLRIIIDWPIRYQGTTTVAWIVDAVVLRSSAGGAAVAIMRQRFERRMNSAEKGLAG